MAKFATNVSGAILLPSSIQVTESISGSVVPLAMFKIFQLSNWSLVYDICLKKSDSSLTTAVVILLEKVVHFLHKLGHLSKQKLTPAILFLPRGAAFLLGKTGWEAPATAFSYLIFVLYWKPLQFLACKLKARNVRNFAKTNAMRQNTINWYRAYLVSNVWDPVYLLH